MKSNTPRPMREKNSEPLALKVGNTIKDRRLDKYLHNRLPEFSRVIIQKHITAGDVIVNGKTAKPSHKLNPGDIIKLTLPEPPPKEITPEQIPLNILYEDDSLIVLNKQAGMVVHPARSNTGGTLVNALAFYSTELSRGTGPFRPGIIHRLDKDTTGVMVVAKKDTAQWKIAKQFELRQTKKNYLAIVHGVPDLTADRINARVGIHPTNRIKGAVMPETGKEAITFYEVLEEFEGFSLMKLNLKTGRTHQIRVHLSYIKHPIVADTLYGGKLVYLWQLKEDCQEVQEPIINRPALHASMLEFKHPKTDEIVKFEAPLPEDMQILLDALRKHRKN